MTDRPPDEPPAKIPSVAIWLPHVAGIVLVQSSMASVSFVLPVLARRHFQANAWETTLVTAAPVVLAMISIFWGALIPRLGLTRYLLCFWAVGLVAMGLAPLVHSYELLAVVAIITAVASAAWWPVAGHLLRVFYPAPIRGRVYASLTVVATLAGAAGSWAVGEALSRDARAFAIFMPAASGIVLVGVGLVALAGGRAGVRGRAEALAVAAESSPGGAARAGLRGFLEPLVHMRQILAADRTFARYEAAFMTYGAGWMIATALVPMLVTDRLNLDYDTFAASTQVAFLLTLVLATMPAGWLMDRLGPVRVCTAAFAFYALYPLGLIIAQGPWGLAAASAVYGLAAGAVNMGWMLGPVSLAPTPEKSSQYVAIHATLVGVRGVVFQFAGVGLYELTGSFTWPLLLAAGAFLWAAWQMRRLQKIMAGRPAAGGD